jgi:hypothetical protein
VSARKRETHTNKHTYRDRQTQRYGSNEGGDKFSVCLQDGCSQLLFPYTDVKRSGDQASPLCGGMCEMRTYFIGVEVERLFFFLRCEV